MEEQQLTIPIDKIKNDFQEFLNPKHNRRIIFSGPFGIGKTYFLNEFFKEKDEEFYSIFLRPINYSLLSNEDVFKLIKYDILTQIIQDENFNIEDEFDFSNADYLKYFLSENRFLILRNLLKAIPKIRNVIPAAEELEKLFSKYQEGVEEINKNPDLELLKDFQQESESNFLLEYDEVSDFISSQLDELTKLKKEGESKLKKVLVIDDLDRLDPEHIFRLFNVFSAHFDQVHYYENSEENDNKFGFDKIIFVCDIENIRKIFAHKYGEQVDFSGYIDKFYSTEIYYFLHDEVFERVIKKYFENRFEFKNHQGEGILINDLLIIVLKLLFSGKELSIRELLRISRYNPSFISKNNVIDYIPVMLSKAGAKQDSVLKQYKLLIIIKLFSEIYGSKEIFLLKLKKAAITYSNNFQFELNYRYGPLLKHIVLFADIEKHNFNYNEVQEANPKEIEFHTNKGHLFNYKIYGGYFPDYYEEGEMWFRSEIERAFELKISNGNFHAILVSAVENVIKYGLV